MSKQVAELYRQLADKIDELEGLKLQLETERQIRKTTEDQLRLADTQLELLSKEKEEYKAQSESFRLQAVDWHQKAIENSEVMTVVNGVFNGYTKDDFSVLESEVWESKGLINPEDYSSTEIYEDEIAKANNLINLAEELKLIKGEFFDESEGEEVEQLNEF